MSGLPSETPVGRNVRRAVGETNDRLFSKRRFSGVLAPCSLGTPAARIVGKIEGFSERYGSSAKRLCLSQALLCR